MKFGTIMLNSGSDSKEMYKKCTKKRDACAQLLFYKPKLIAFPFSLPSSLLKFPNVGEGRGTCVYISSDIKI